jgi:hypothetical protein
MRVDRVFDRTAHPWHADQLTADSYRDDTPSDRWEVAIEGASIVLTEMGTSPAPAARLEGKEAWSTEGERRFQVVGGGSGDHEQGLFVLRGDEAELTLFGARQPIVMSERGKLLSL